MKASERRSRKSKEMAGRKPKRPTTCAPEHAAPLLREVDARAIETFKARQKEHPHMEEVGLATLGPDGPDIAHAANALMTGDPALAFGICSQLQHIAHAGHHMAIDRMNFMLSIINGIAPRDPTEALPRQSDGRNPLRVHGMREADESSHNDRSGRRRAVCHKSTVTHILCPDGDPEALPVEGRAEHQGSARQRECRTGSRWHQPRGRGHKDKSCQQHSATPGQKRRIRSLPERSSLARRDSSANRAAAAVSRSAAFFMVLLLL